MRNSYLVIAGFLAAIFMAELLSLAYIGISSKKLFYTIPGSSIPTLADEQEIKNKYLIHPYFGYVLSPHITVGSVTIPSGRIRHMYGKSGPLPVWVKLSPNNHGFWSKYDYPLRPESSDSFIVGVFGGSVAQWLTVQKGDYLEKELARLPALRGKHVHVINMALGGYKQPQQLQVLSYFMAMGQHFDLIINLDGFNEIALPISENIAKGIHYSMPRSYPSNLSSMTSIATTKMIRWLDKGLDLRGQKHKWASRKNHRRSASFYLLASAFHARYQGLSEAHMLSSPPRSRAERNVFVSLDSNSEGLTRKQQKAALVDLWLQSSVLMRDVTQQHGAAYLHVLQPNQYHSKKKLSTQERRIALPSRHPYSKATRELYPVLINRSAELVEKGVQFFDATPIFDEIDSTIYADSCCHYNDSGNQLLVDNIVREVGNSALPTL